MEYLRSSIVCDRCIHSNSQLQFIFFSTSSLTAGCIGFGDRVRETVKLSTFPPRRLGGLAGLPASWWPVPTKQHGHSQHWQRLLGWDARSISKCLTVVEATSLFLKPEQKVASVSMGPLEGIGLSYATLFLLHILWLWQSKSLINHPILVIQNSHPMNPEVLQLIQWVFSPSAVPPSGSHCDMNERF